MNHKPEIFYLETTPFVPNSRLPVLLYRHVLPQPLDISSAQTFLEANQWIKGVSGIYYLAFTSRLESHCTVPRSVAV